jgi:hypothetical protein
MAPPNNAKIMEKLLGMSGAVPSVGRRNVHEYVLRTPSPSLNFCFGHAHGLPAGFTLQVSGPPKCGKTVFTNSMIAQLHKDDPTAFAVKFDTEMREEGQLTEEDMVMWGIDPSRYICFQTNRPDEVFDRIENDFLALVQDRGWNLKMVAIDSTSQLQGRRALNATSINTQQIGDNAATIQEGLKRILPVQRRLRFGLVLTSHVRAQMDPLEVKRGNKYRIQSSFGQQHVAEYNLFIEANRNAAGKVDLEGKSYYDERVEDVAGRGEKTAHRIKCKMIDSTMGPKERSGEFSFDYHNGIINTWEEVFKLGTGYNIIERPNQLTYAYGGKEYRGKPAIFEALKNDPNLCKGIVDELRRRDQANELSKGAPESVRDGSDPLGDDIPTMDEE